MITHFFKTIRSKSAQSLDDYKPGSWVYVVDPTEEEIDQLTEKFNLERGLLTDALDEDEVPRLESEGDTSYLYTRYVMTDADLRVVTMPLLIIVSDAVLITVSPKALPRLQRFLDGKIEFTTTQRTKLVLQILEQVVDQYDVYLSSIARQIKAIRSRLRVEEIRNQDFVDFVLIEDELNEFLAALVPTNAILRRLLLGKHIKLYDEDENLVEDLLLNNEQSIEACKSSLKSIVNIREAYATIMSNNLNRIIRVLTVVTVLISVPTLVGTIYGMNVTTPYENAPHAFWGIMAFSVLLSLALMLFLRAKKLL